MKLKDKVVLITGGGSGLGREMGLTFSREGAKVGVNDIRPESAGNVVTEIARLGGTARPFVADVSSSAAVVKMFAEFIAAFGTIDILINNAGIARASEVDNPDLFMTHQKTDEDWHKMLATHRDASSTWDRSRALPGWRSPRTTVRRRARSSRLPNQSRAKWCRWGFWSIASRRDSSTRR